MNPAEGAGDGPLRYLALGDSYTIGEGVAADERWPVRLAAMLREHGVAVRDPVIVARTGWTTDELAAAIAAIEPGPPFDLVSLCIGVNDHYRGRPVERFRADFEPLLDRASGLARVPERLVVASIPDWGATPFAAARDRRAIAREIDAFNAVARRAAARARAAFIDVTELSRARMAQPGALVADGLHPAGPFYEEWALRVLGGIREEL